MSKAWLIGFTEAEGSFYLVNKSKDRIVHAFEITQKLDKIVLTAIAHILGIKCTTKRTHYTVISFSEILCVINWNYFTVDKTSSK